MKLLSFIHPQDGSSTWGVVVGESEVVEGKALTEGRFTSLREVLGSDFLHNMDPNALKQAHTLALSALTLLPVIPDPGKILCVGLNYEEHRLETKRPPTGQPTIFLRVASSQIGHGQAIVVPEESEMVDYEGEIAIVIGKKGRHIQEEDAWTHIAGYAPYNDVSVRDWQNHTSQWTPGKNFDATGCFGPWLVTRDDVPDGADLTLTTRLNGAVMQQAGTSQLIFSIPRLIQYISQFATLEVGDVIVTGTPGGVGFKRTPPVYLKAGDRIEVEVEGVGVLANDVI
ncbi:fumarylacetoacetate hydrolase family protein [Parapusillimonas sp. JC17]|uniref:fumarylacetoacetate hydrolase family protein n=1 Tax=Parapusillimonas sp. JC17 TaxID=3445768 RepID=UPI003F9EE028